MMTAHSPQQSSSNLDDILKELEDRFGSQPSPSSSYSHTTSHAAPKSNWKLLVGALAFFVTVAGTAAGFQMGSKPVDIQQQAYVAPAQPVTPQEVEQLAYAPEGQGQVEGVQIAQTTTQGGTVHCGYCGGFDIPSNGTQTCNDALIARLYARACNTGDQGISMAKGVWCDKYTDLCTNCTVGVDCWPSQNSTQYCVRDDGDGNQDICPPENSIYSTLYRCDGFQLSKSGCQSSPVQGAITFDPNFIGTQQYDLNDGSFETRYFCNNCTNECPPGGCLPPSSSSPTPTATPKPTCSVELKYIEVTTDSKTGRTTEREVAPVREAETFDDGLAGTLSVGAGSGLGKSIYIKENSSLTVKAVISGANRPIARVRFKNTKESPSPINFLSPDNELKVSTAPYKVGYRSGTIGNLPEAKAIVRAWVDMKSGAVDNVGVCTDKVVVKIRKMPETTCNSVCSTLITPSQCPSGLVCYAPTGTTGNCRLASNPTSTTCQPPASPPSPSPVPICLGIKMHNYDNPGNQTPPITVNVNNRLNFTCSPINGAKKYRFRLVTPGLSIVDLEPVSVSSNISKDYTVTEAGPFKAECSFCMNLYDEQSCSAWESENTVYGATQTAE